jgi:alpha-glucosidase
MENTLTNFENILHQGNATRPLEKFPDEIISVNKDRDTVLFTCKGNVMLRVQVITDYILRFRYATDGYFQEDFSYAIDKAFEGGYTKFELHEEEGCWQIRTATLKCCIKKKNLKAIFTDAETGREINRDEKGFHWEPHPLYGGNIVIMSKTVQHGEHYFGLGDKPMQLNLRGRRVQNWATDEYGYIKDKDPLYKTIPFYVGIHNGLSYGVFMDNTFKSFFDFASERNSATSFWAHGGEMNYYFIYGKNPLEVVERYTNLTGKPELPPLWAMGYHQCKWSYYPESVVRDLAAEFRKRQIPCDALYLDIDYMDGFRCFTWDKNKFPEPHVMVKDLAADGFKTVVIIDPGIKIDWNYSVFKEAYDKGYFCKRADGDYMKGKVWPGECYFPDFTKAEVREWWATLFKGLIAEDGVRGVWNDMNEPAVMEVESKTFPPDVRHDFDGHPCSHRKAHNVYGAQMARATFHGVKRFAKPNRPFIITRSLYSGTQRYSSTWTGDNIATWEHLWVANMQMQRMAISGYSFVGSDIGGFTEHPTSELYVRWIQLATFHPLMRTHSSGQHGNQEPWSFSEEATEIVKAFIELRYKLLPYLYTTFWQYASSGTPMLRPLAFLDGNDPNLIHRTNEFLCGDHILVCPVTDPGTQQRYIYLPQGRWYNYFTNQLLDGGKEVHVDAPLETMPLFMRAGSVIPHYPIMQYVGEKKLEQLTLWAYYSKDKTRSTVYEDACDGYDYQKGNYCEKTFTLSAKDNEITIRQHINGKYEPDYDKYDLQLVGLPFEPVSVLLDDVPVNTNICKISDTHFEILVPRNFEVLKIVG